MARRIIWDRRRNPTRYVSDNLGIDRWRLGDAIHKIKRRSNLTGTDRVIIYDDGSVADVDGTEIGNVYDEI
jgi:hypothetical protein